MSRLTSWRACVPQGALAAALAASAALLAGCASTPAAPERSGSSALRSPSGLVATLEDDVRALPGQHIAWSTYWNLCWEPSPAAAAYELQAITGEGVSPTLQRQSGRCIRLQAAAGRNRRSRGLVNRDLLVQLKSGQLAYRVRAVRRGGEVSEWSPPVSVGSTAHTIEPA